VVEELEKTSTVKVFRMFYFHILK